MRFAHALARLRQWAMGNWLRSLLVAGTILSLIGLTIGGWAYLASIALQTGQISIENVLALLDQGQHEEARNDSTRLLTSGQLPRSEYGCPLFVLGAVKLYEAESQALPQRRHAEFAVASRYLTEARAYGLPPSRDATCAFLLGKSLIESGQFEGGVLVLVEFIGQSAAKIPDQLEAKYLLAETCLVKPQPNFQDALRHNTALLGHQELTVPQREAAVVQRVACLSRLQRYNDARSEVQKLPAEDTAALRCLLAGTIGLDELESEIMRLPAADRAAAITSMKDRFTATLANLQRAGELDASKGPVSQQSCYQLARGLALQGDLVGALKQYARTRQLYGDSDEGLAATLGEAEALRQQGDYEDSMLAYQRLLAAYDAIPVYRSRIVPVERIRERTTAAINDFIKNGRFAEALGLIDHSSPVFSQADQLELRGGALELCGNQRIQHADESDYPASEQALGRENLRAAGVAFEQLAELRFATRHYTTDLWRAAEDFFQGHSYSRAIAALHKYLQYEPELRNAQALVRLGQAHLALGQIALSVSSLEECIEFHPFDASTYQARIDCAKAHWYQGNTDRAEELLRENIGGTALKPLSPEWRDALFELGMLLHEKEEFEDSIARLEEAVERYPNDPQRLIAQYVIGESYRRWALQKLEESHKSRSASEREKARLAATERLTTALRHFEDVQRTITLKTHDIQSDRLMGTMLRNCYMLEGAVLFDLGRYKDAIEAYSNVSSLYPDEPFVLETFVQIANCWRRLERHDNARGAVRQAQIVLERLPPNSDFVSTTVHNREEWRTLLTDMSRW